MRLRMRMCRLGSSDARVIGRDGPLITLIVEDLEVASGGLLLGLIQKRRLRRDQQFLAVGELVVLEEGDDLTFVALVVFPEHVAPDHVALAAGHLLTKEIKRFLESCDGVIKVLVSKRNGFLIKNRSEDTITNPVSGPIRDDAIDQKLRRTKKGFKNVLEQALAFLILDLFFTRDKGLKAQPIRDAGKILLGNEVDAEARNNLDALGVLELRETVLDVPHDGFVARHVSQDFQVLIISIGVNRNVRKNIRIGLHRFLVRKQVKVSCLEPAALQEGTDEIAKGLAAYAVDVFSMLLIVFVHVLIIVVLDLHLHVKNIFHCSKLSNVQK